MKAIDLYNQLEKDFVKPGMKEDWYSDMTGLDEYVCDNLKQRSMGLLCDFATEVNQVYTAVFPSDKALAEVLDDGATDAMVFLHHPSDWDLSRDPNKAFYDMNTDLLSELRKRRISLFNFHYPLDNFGPYANSKTLAYEMGIVIEKPFAESGGALCGVIGTTDCKSITELQAKYAKAVGHDVKLYPYGESTIKNGRIAIVAGGGNDADVVTEVIENNVNVLITGLSLKNNYSIAAHELEEKNGINLLGGTHYSSEKFGCIAMCEYFGKLGLLARFIEDVPCMLDM